MCGTSKVLAIVKVFSHAQSGVTCRSIVFSFISRDYLKVVFNARHGTAVTRLRIRNNRFYVETDSWYNNSVP